jgi:hypothetical protein
VPLEELLDDLEGLDLGDDDEQQQQQQEQQRGAAAADLCQGSSTDMMED